MAKKKPIKKKKTKSISNKKSGKKVKSMAKKTTSKKTTAKKKTSAAKVKKNKVVKTKIVHLSIYALFAFTGVPEYRPKERIITPSYQDGKNDIANFDILVGKDVEIKIYDITGRKVRTVNVLTEGNIWNGKDGFGNLVESGVYLYQFKLDEKLYSGTIAVAK